MNLEGFLADLAVALAAAAFAKLLDVVDRKLSERDKAPKHSGKHAKRP